MNHPKVAQLFGVDIRALAALRVGLAVVLLFDLARRAPYLAALYSGQGVLPKDALHHVSLHAINGSPIFTAMLFLLAAGFALLLLAGYHTWLATAASWLLVSSLQTRNVLVNNSGDHLLALLLFWGMFLPLGAWASVDSRISKPRSPVPPVVLSVATVALMLQAIYPYLFSALIKSYKLWVGQALAIYTAMNLDGFTRPAGRWLLEYPTLVRWMSPLTYFFELYGPFFAFFPVKTSWFRGFTAAAFIGFHLGLQVTMNLDVFAYICMVMWVVFFPPGFWDRALALRPVAALGRGWGFLLDRVARVLEKPLAEQPWLAPPPDDGRATRPGNVLAGALIVYLLVWNVGTKYPQLKMPELLRWPGEQLYIGQKWEMFKRPPLDDGWWVMPAKLHDGSEVDLFTGGAPVRWEKPASVMGIYAGAARWNRYMDNLWRTEDARRAVAPFAAWTRRTWNAGHPPEQRIESMQIYYVVELTRPDYKPPSRSDQLVYEWDSSGAERTTDIAENRSAMTRDVGADPTIVSDVMRTLGIDSRDDFDD